ncbi:MAG TPA: alkaline phosphatase PafA [Flavisolibacter sp.]|jgi:predicted AlkP superfamily pyrophosphatase or phosphodiesterase|nr:alkaline phosphatase PafA [Flavisolibacter sp.]
MRKTFLMVLLLAFGSAFSQLPSRPKLVVGVVVDQMRWDYLYRYADRYSNDGFRRLLREGFSCENAFIPYTPTVTAAGHTCIYTGSVPALHGIMGNNWYDRATKKVVYCTDDSLAASVGSSSVAGKMSPRNLWSNTITDELRLATNFKNKTIAIALKDRGAILPGGHTANAAYWFDNSSGGWISSTFYMQQLPDWVRKFNDRKLPDQYLAQSWNTLYPIQSYMQSTADSNRYEGKIPGEDMTFPHTTSSLGANKYEAFRYLPSGNTFTFEMARTAIQEEQLGKRGVTDFLAVSFSSTDYVGHTFGPNSIEAEDTYLRFDKDLGSFLKYLDVAIGKGQYLLFLTADHGAANNPAFLQDNRIPSGVYNEAMVNRQLNDSLTSFFHVNGLIEHSINYQLYLNDSLIRLNNLDSKTVKQYIIRMLLRQPAVSQAVDLSALETTTVPTQIRMMLANGYNQKLSGDIQVLFKPQWFETWRTGTTHGLWNPYDAHIPLLWFGWKIKPGKTSHEVYMTDIAPTIASLLEIQMPNATIGKVIEEAVR